MANYNIYDYGDELGKYTKEFIFGGNDYFNASFDVVEGYKCNYCGDLVENNTHYRINHKNLGGKFINSDGDITENIEEGYSKVYALNSTIIPLNSSEINFYNEYLTLKETNAVKAKKLLERQDSTFKKYCIGLLAVTITLSLIIAIVFGMNVKNKYGEDADLFIKIILGGLVFLLLTLASTASSFGVAVKLTDRIEDFTPAVYENQHIFKHYTADKKSKYLLDDVAEELTAACKNGDTENFKIIMNNLNKINEAKVKDDLTRKEKIDEQLKENLASENEAKVNRKALNPILTGATIHTHNYQYTDTTEYHKLSKILNQELLSKIVKLNGEFTKHDTSDVPLNITDKIKMDNCRNEYKDNVNNLLKMSETLPITVELQEDFERLVNTCLVIMDTVGTGAIEQSKDTVNISNMFLTDKYKELFDDKKDKDYVAIDLNRENGRRPL